VIASAPRIQVWGWQMADPPSGSLRPISDDEANETQPSGALGEYIVQERLRRDRSEAAVARLGGIDRGTLRNIISGKQRQPRYETLQAIAKGLAHGNSNASYEAELIYANLLHEGGWLPKVLPTSLLEQLSSQQIEAQAQVLYEKWRADIINRIQSDKPSA